MKLIIDIPEKRYKDIIRISTIQAYSDYYPTYERIIANGTPIPDKWDVLGKCITCIDYDVINNHCLFMPDYCIDYDKYKPRKVRSEYEIP